MNKISIRGNSNLRDVARSLGNVEEAIFYDACNHWMPAGDFSTTNYLGRVPAVFVSAQNNKTFPGWRLDNGNHSELVAYVRRHRGWTGGTMCMRIHYNLYEAGSTVAHTYISIEPTNVGEEFNPVAWNLVTADLPNQSASDGAVSVSDTIYVTFSSTFREAVAFGILIQRDGAHVSDTSAASLYIHGVELEFIQSPRNIGGVRQFRVTGR